MSRFAAKLIVWGVVIGIIAISNYESEEDRLERIDRMRVAKEAAVKRTWKEAVGEFPNEVDYLKYFVSRAGKFGIDLTHVFDEHLYIEEAGLTRMRNGKIEFLPQDVHAYTDSKDRDRIRIYLVKGRYTDVSNLNKQGLFYHELAHDVLNLPHIDHINLSNPYVPNYTSARQLNKDLDQLFRYYIKNKK